MDIVLVFYIVWYYSCNFKFIIIAVDCQWSPWTLGQCSKTCGDGSMTKTRTQEISAANGGDECEGADSLDETCNVRDCPGIEI